MCRHMKDPSLTEDLIISAFQSALYSFRKNSLIKSFPSFLTSNDEDDFYKLEHELDELLSNYHNLSIASNIRLKEWIIEQPQIKIHTCPETELAYITSLTKQTIPTPKPRYIFGVYDSQNVTCISNNNDSYMKYYAYHGSPFENLYSILNQGLLPSQGKNNLFGDGIYFSSELSMSLNYSKCGKGFPASKFLGRQLLSFVLVCELTDNMTDDIKCAKDKITPDTYFIVKDKELIKIKYILVYTSNDLSIPVHLKRAIKKMFRPIKYFSLTSDSWIFPMLMIYLTILIILAATKNSDFINNLVSKTLFQRHAPSLSDIY